MTDLPNPESAGDWYGKRAHGPAWSGEFLAATLAAGSLVETGPVDRSTAAVWGRVLATVLLGGSAIGAILLFVLR